MSTDLALDCCPSCGSGEITIGPGQGPHHASLRCDRCGHSRWIGRPIEAGEAAGFVMPFGRHRGTPMGELPRSYLEWLAHAEKIASGIAKRARVLLAEPHGGGG